jgi:hypothetical protein
MPKDEFDFEDPLELNGVAFLTEDDTSAEMTECFAEEFMRMGYNHKQMLALFRNPHYVGPNMVLSNKGEQFVRDIIAETFAKWGRPVFWTESQPVQSALPPHPDPLPGGEGEASTAGSPTQRASTLPAAVELPFPLPEGEGEGERLVLQSGDCGARGCASSPSAQQNAELEDPLADPMGNLIPKLR